MENTRGNKRRRKSSRQRASGGMLIGCKKGLKSKVTTEERGVIGEIELTIDAEKWHIFGLYIRNNTEALWTNLEERTNRLERVIFMGDFNARPGEKGGIPEQETRNSKEKIINDEGITLLQKKQENGMWILNEGNQDDCDEEYTQLGKGRTVIDYTMVKEN